MRCPHCRNELLIAIEYDRIEVDYCVGCKGIWLDAGEVELLFGDAAAARDFLTIGSPAPVPHGEKPRRCPECDARMTKESTESDPPVIFDHCPRGDGLWLDRGELETVLTHGEAFARRGPVSSLLRGMFTDPGRNGPAGVQSA